MEIKWEKIQSGKIFLIATEYIQRAKVPGGWFIKEFGGPIFFYPDPKHEWDGNSLP